MIKDLLQVKYRQCGVVKKSLKIQENQLKEQFKNAYSTNVFVWDESIHEIGTCSVLKHASTKKIPGKAAVSGR